MPLHCTRTTAAPIPPARLHRSSRRAISCATSGSRWSIKVARGTRHAAMTENRRAGSGSCGRYASSMFSACVRMFAGMRRIWSAWNAHHERSVWCAEQNLCRFLAIASSPPTEAAASAFTEAIKAEVCWQMALWDGQWRFWQS